MFGPILVIRIFASFFAFIVELLLGPKNSPENRRQNLFAVTVMGIGFIAVVAVIWNFGELSNAKEANEAYKREVAEKQLQLNIRIRDLAAARYHVYTYLLRDHVRYSPKDQFTLPPGFKLSLRPGEYTGKPELLYEFAAVIENNGSVDFSGMKPIHVPPSAESGGTPNP